MLQGTRHEALWGPLADGQTLLAAPNARGCTEHSKYSVYGDCQHHVHHLGSWVVDIWVVPYIGIRTANIERAQTHFAERQILTV
jgi:hypothetical protein